MRLDVYIRPSRALEWKVVKKTNLCQRLVRWCKISRCKISWVWLRDVGWSFCPRDCVHVWFCSVRSVLFDRSIFYISKLKQARSGWGIMMEITHIAHISASTFRISVSLAKTLSCYCSATRSWLCVGLTGLWSPLPSPLIPSFSTRYSPKTSKNGKTPSDSAGEMESRDYGWQGKR